MAVVYNELLGQQLVLNGLNLLEMADEVVVQETNTYQHFQFMWNN